MDEETKRSAPKSTSKKDWKEKMKRGEAINMSWNVRKNRHGKVGRIDMTFDGKTGIFADADDRLNEYSKDFQKIIPD